MEKTCKWVDTLLFQVKVWFQNRRTKEKRIKPGAEIEDGKQVHTEGSDHSEHEEIEDKNPIDDKDKRTSITKEEFEKRSDENFESHDQKLPKKKQYKIGCKKKSVEVDDSPRKHLCIKTDKCLFPEKLSNNCSSIDSDISSV